MRDSLVKYIWWRIKQFLISYFFGRQIKLWRRRKGRRLGRKGGGRRGGGRGRNREGSFFTKFNAISFNTEGNVTLIRVMDKQRWRLFPGWNFLRLEYFPSMSKLFCFGISCLGNECQMFTFIYTMDSVELTIIMPKLEEIFQCRRLSF